MKRDFPHDPVATKARELLDHSADNLDRETLDRLARARQAALRGELKGRKSGSPVAWRGAAGGLAVAAGLLMAVWVGVWQPNTTPDAVPLTAVQDMDVLTSEDQLDFIEDLEFAQWLMEEGAPGIGLEDAG